VTYPGGSWDYDHCFAPGVAIETTACGTQYRHRTLVCLLGHC